MRKVALTLTASFLVLQVFSQSYEEALEAFEYAEYTEAIAILDRAIDQSPSQVRLHVLKARCMLGLKETDAALEYIRDQLEILGDHSMLFHWKGEAYIKKLNEIDGFFESGRILLKARDALYKSVKLDENNLDARLTLAGYYFEAPGIIGGSTHKAEREIRYVRAKNPLKAAMYMADYHFQQRKWENAKQELLNVISRNVADVEAYHLLGRVYQMTEQYDSAFLVFSRGIEMGHLDSHYQFAKTAIFAKTDVTTGIKYMQEYLTTRPRKGSPSLPHGWWRLGMLYELEKDTVSALKSYNTALRLNPELQLAIDAIEKLTE